MSMRKLLALLLPFIACTVQWLLWDAFIKPYVWFLFFPTAFCSAWLGGFRIGLISSVTSALLVWYIYMPPQFSFALNNAASGASIVMFVLMGALFAQVFEQLRQAMHKTDEALKTAEAAKAEVQQLYEKTLELDKLKSQFFANVSHELRTPLTLIMAPLEQRWHQPLDPEQRRETEMMLRNARLLYRHVSDLLDAAKLEGGEMRMHFCRVNLAELVRVSAANFDGVVLDRHISYQITTPKELWAELDGEKIERILINLLANAFKFTPDAGTIRVELSQESDTAVLAVHDSGPGVPPSMRERIFERFQQLDSEHGGTGLGLAIVKEFAELHRGTVQVLDSSCGGALFRITLPVTAPAGVTVHQDVKSLNPIFEQQAVESVLPVTLIPQPSNTADLPLILVVEDNPDMNRFICDNLQASYRVVAASNGREGLEQALALKPDLILSDVMMPVMSGDEMVLALRSHPEMTGIPIVMLTAKADDMLRVRMLEAGVQDYLSKPFAVQELLARVASLVAERRRNVAQLHASETRFEMTFEQAAVGIALISPDGHWLRINHKLCQMLAYPMHELLNVPPKRLCHPDDVAQLSTQMQSLLSHQTESIALEIRCLPEHGEFIWINLTAALVWNSAQQPDYFIVVMEDISERKRAHEEIERLVTERTAELVAANKELDSFAYAVSHDLRAPLRAMSGFSQALQQDLADKLQGEEKEYLQQIDIAGQKMAQLIDGLLTLSRSTRGELQRDEVDLSVLSEQCLSSLATAEPERQVDYQIEPELRVRGDARMLNSVLNNLLQNAWKYTSKTQNAQIRVYSKTEQGRRYICVSDNGAGFDMSHASHLFQPFQRLHRQEEFAGLGIGLATVQRIIHRHGGEIKAQAQPGQGATFSFTLSDI